MNKIKNISVKEFDKKFDSGESIIEYLDLKKVERKSNRKNKIKKGSGIAPQKRKRNKPE